MRLGFVNLHEISEKGVTIKHSSSLNCGTHIYEVQYCSMSHDSTLQL